MNDSSLCDNMSVNRLILYKIIKIIFKNVLTVKPAPRLFHSSFHSRCELLEAC